MEKEKTTELRLRINWSAFPYYEPIRIIIPDWFNIRRFYNFMVVDSIMEYKGRMIELCVPYYMFITAVKFRNVREQRLIRDGKAVIELMKTHKKDHHGIIISKVEEWKPKGNG